MTKPCHYCQKPINPDSPAVLQRMIGWTKKGQAGGSDVYFRERLEAFMCSACFEKCKAGVQVGQGSLV